MTTRHGAPAQNSALIYIASIIKNRFDKNGILHVDWTILI